MPRVEPSSPSLLTGATGPTTSTAEDHETPSPILTPSAPLAEDTRRDGCREGAGEEQVDYSISDGPTGAPKRVGGGPPKGGGLVILDEAVDDGTAVNTAGTLVFTELEVRYPPRWLDVCSYST